MENSFRFARTFAISLVMGRLIFFLSGFFIISCASGPTVTSTNPISDGATSQEVSLSYLAANDSRLIGRHLEPGKIGSEGDNIVSGEGGSTSLPGVSEPKAGYFGIGSSGVQEDKVITWEEDAATSGFVDSLLSVAANPEHYREEFISGRAFCRPSVSEGEVPCMNLNVLLMDRNGSEVSRVKALDGEFVFLAEPQKQYQIKIESDRYHPVSPLPWVAMGSDVSLHLIRK